MTTSRGETGPLTDPRKQVYLPYLRDLADRMGLKDWSVTILDRPPADGNRCSVWMRYGGKQAQVLMSEECLSGTPEQMRADLVHELIHPHFAASDGIVEDALSHELYRSYQRMWEYGIDGIAEAWAPFLPLPPTPERETRP